LPIQEAGNDLAWGTLQRLRGHDDWTDGALAKHWPAGLAGRTTALTRIGPVLNAVALVAPIPILTAALLASSVLMVAVSQAAADDAT
jgi:hypothetical protein